MGSHSKRRGRLRRTAPFLISAGALALGGCVDDGYGYGPGVYAGAGYYGGGYYDGWDDGFYGYPGYGWTGDYYYPGSGIYIYDRGGHRHHWDGHGRPGNGWVGGGSNWHGSHGNWHGNQGGVRGGNWQGGGTRAAGRWQGSSPSLGNRGVPNAGATSHGSFAPPGVGHRGR